MAEAFRFLLVDDDLSLSRYRTSLNTSSLTLSLHGRFQINEKKLKTLATEKELAQSLSLSLSTEAVRDYAGTSVVAVTRGCDVVIADTTPPRVVNASLNLSSEVLSVQVTSLSLSLSLSLLLSLYLYLCLSIGFMIKGCSPCSVF